MSTIKQKRVFTPKDLLAMPDSVCFELLDGKLVERKTSVLSSMVEGLIAARLQTAANISKEGEVFSGSLGYRCYANAPDRIRKSGVSFVRRERFSPKFYSDEFMLIRPDIAVEVISPHDLATESVKKTEEYLRLGVPLVWIVNPELRSIQIHRPDSTVTELHETDELTGEGIFPAFRCRVAELFPRRTTR